MALIEFPHHLTVGELKNILATISDDCTVVLENGDWYAHVSEIGIPDPDDENYGDYWAVTFFHGDDFCPVNDM